MGRKINQPGAGRREAQVPGGGSMGRGTSRRWGSAEEQLRQGSSWSASIERKRARVIFVFTVSLSLTVLGIGIALWLNPNFNEGDIAAYVCAPCSFLIFCIAFLRFFLANVRYEDRDQKKLAAEVDNLFEDYSSAPDAASLRKATQIQMTRDRSSVDSRIRDTRRYGLIAMAFGVLIIAFAVIPIIKINNIISKGFLAGIVVIGLAFSIYMSNKFFNLHDSAVASLDKFYDHLRTTSKNLEAERVATDEKVSYHGAAREQISEALLRQAQNIDLAIPPKGNPYLQGRLSNHGEHANERLQIEGSRIGRETTGVDVVLTEKHIDRADLTIVRLVAGRSSVALELHDGYYTYYWTCRFASVEFVRQMQARLDIKSTRLTLLDIHGQVRQMPLSEANIFAHSEERNPAEQWTLVRFDGPEQSWVWQYAPDTTTDKIDSNILTAYTGCASLANHMENFRKANEFLADSALDSDYLIRHIHLLENYLSRWDGSK